MEASNGTGLFHQYFVKLSDQDKSKMLDSLVKGVLGQVPDLRPYLALLTHTLVGFAMSGQTKFIEPHIDLIEASYNDKQNIQSWVKAPDNEAIPSGIEFKKTWHYAMCLAKVLRACGSRMAVNTTEFLRENATSSRLRAQLI
jgi:hypothetical protein